MPFMELLLCGVTKGKSLLLVCFSLCWALLRRQRILGQAQFSLEKDSSCLSFPQHRACLAVTVPQLVLARAPVAPASRAVQTDPGSCAVACRH